MKEYRLQEIFYEIKPELEEKGDLHGYKLIDDMGFDSVDVLNLIVELENITGKEIENMEKFMDTIQEYDQIENWLLEKTGDNNG